MVVDVAGRDRSAACPGRPGRPAKGYVRTDVVAGRRPPAAGASGAGSGRSRNAPQRRAKHKVVCPAWSATNAGKIGPIHSRCCLSRIFIAGLTLSPKLKDLDSRHA